MHYPLLPHRIMLVRKGLPQLQKVNVTEKSARKRRYLCGLQYLIFATLLFICVRQKLNSSRTWQARTSCRRRILKIDQVRGRMIRSGNSVRFDKV